MSVSAPNQIWQHGLPDASRKAIRDMNGQYWDLGSQVKDNHTLYHAAETSNAFELISKSFISYGSYFDYKIAHDPTGLPLNDDSWTQIEELYKRLLGMCSYKCYHDETPCLNAFGVLKWATPSTDDNHKFEENVQLPSLMFKCYGYSDEASNISYMIDVTKTKMWKAFGADGEYDPGMVFTHLYHKGSDYYENGHCTDCIWHFGLPDSAFKAMNGWSVGSLANEKPIFTKQESTAAIQDYSLIKAYVIDGDDSHRYEPLDKMTKLTSDYTEQLEKCRKACEADKDCGGANAVVAAVDGSKITDDWDTDILPFKNDSKAIIFKCYGFKQDDIKKQESYLKSVDTQWRISGTRQFQTEEGHEQSNVYYSHYYIKKVTTPSPTKTTKKPNQIWQYGLPDASRNSITDMNGYSWDLGSYVNDHHTLYHAAGTSNAFVLMAEPFTMFIDYGDYLNYEIAHDPTVLPLYDDSWTQIEELYKRFLGNCSYKCYHDETPCLNAFGVLKWATPSTDDDHKFEEKIQTNHPLPTLVFKCYGYSDDATHYKIDTTNKKMWVPKGNHAKADPGMVFTHIWKKGSDYHENGHCHDCIWKFGLPDSAFEAMNGWSVGSLANEKPIFTKQESTAAIQDYSLIKAYVIDSDTALLEPPNKLKDLTSDYTENLGLCRKACEADKDCGGANAVVGAVDGSKITDDWDTDVLPLGKVYDYEVIVFKCYGFKLDDIKKQESYLKSVDTKYKVSGTRQFKTEEGHEQLNVYYSHYYIKKVTTPSPTTTTKKSTTTTKKPTTTTKKPTTTTKKPTTTTTVPTTTTNKPTTTTKKPTTTTGTNNCFCDSFEKISQQLHDAAKLLTALEEKRD